MITFKGRHTPQSIILQCVRWYCAYPLSYRNIEEMMAERGLKIDHSTLNRWVVHYAPKLEKAFHKKKKLPGNRWRIDETYLKVRGQWRYYYRAVDKAGVNQFNDDNNQRVKIYQCKYLNNITQQDHRNIKRVTNSKRCSLG